MQYQVNSETAWIIGLWAADRGSTAKGVVSINNKNNKLLQTFREKSLNNFDITESKFRKRILKGYGISKELYFTRLPVRKFIENKLFKRKEFNDKQKLAYFAGRFDGDGNVSAKSSVICIYYAHKEKRDAILDKEMLIDLGFDCSIERGKKILRLRIRQPRFFTSSILLYVKHPRKVREIEKLLKKRPYGPYRTRPVPLVATPFYGREAL